MPPTTRMPIGLATLAITATLIAAATGCTGAARPTSGQGGSDQAAPTFDVRLLSGQRVTNLSVRGKPTLISFFASW